MKKNYKQIYCEMLSQNPVNVKSLGQPEKDIENIRLAMVGELDSINLYEQMVKTSNNPKVIEILSDIAKEEKQHVGELQVLLDELDPQNHDLRHIGKDEVRIEFPNIGHKEDENKI